MMIRYVPKVELTEEEKNALLLSAKILDEICAESDCSQCILHDFCDKEFDPMDTPQKICDKIIGESV